MDEHASMSHPSGADLRQFIFTLQGKNISIPDKSMCVFAPA